MVEIKIRNKDYEGKWSACKDGKLILYYPKYSEKVRIWVKCPIIGQLVEESSCKTCGQRISCMR